VPLMLGGGIRASARIAVLLLGILTFLAGVALCVAAGQLRDRSAGERSTVHPHAMGYLFAAGSGIMAAAFNVGFTLSLPIVDAGVHAGNSPFGSTNCIWLLMLGAGSIPNIAYCGFLMKRNHSAGLMDAASARPWILGVLMGLLWSGSIFLYGAAVPRLGDIGPSIGWPVSLAVALLASNAMGILLGEWRDAPAEARSRMRSGILVLVLAIILCATSTRLTA